MNISHSPFTRVFLEAVNKKLLVETKKVPEISLKRIKNLEPVRDIDDNIVTYSPYKKKSYNEPTSYEDCFERMSFERDSEEFDFWRHEESYRKGEKENYLYERYSEDDIPLADNIIKQHLGLKNYLPAEYCPSTDIDYDAVCKLKLIDLETNIIPNIFDRRIEVNNDTIHALAKEAEYAWEKGVSTNEIIQLLEKSIVDGGKLEKSEPNVDLFKFLTRNPNKRSIVVLKTDGGREIFDKSAAIYYEAFSKRFKDSNTAIQVLNECRIPIGMNNSIAPVDSKLCDIVTLLRRRSALGMPEEFAPGYYTNIKVLNCSSETPWGSKESELIKRLKPNGELDIDAYKGAKTMLSEHGCTVDFVLENLDNYIKLDKDVVRQISYDMAKKLGGTQDRTRLTIEENLMKVVEKIKKSKLDKLSEGIELINLVGSLNSKDFPIKAIHSALQMYRKLETYGTPEDLTNFNAFVRKLADSKEAYPYAEGFIAQCRKMCQITRSFGKKEVQFMQFVLDKGLKEGDWAYHKAMKQIIENANYRWNVSVFDYAQKHLELFASYVKVREASDYNKHRYSDLGNLYWGREDECLEHIKNVIKMESTPKDLSSTT